MSTKETKVRKAKARHRDVILGAIDERFSSLLEGRPDGDAVLPRNVERLRELLDELRRATSLNDGKKDEADSE